MVPTEGIVTKKIVERKFDTMLNKYVFVLVEVLDMLHLYCAFEGISFVWRQWEPWLIWDVLIATIWCLIEEMCCFFCLLFMLITGATIFCCCSWLLITSYVIWFVLSNVASYSSPLFVEFPICSIEGILDGGQVSDNVRCCLS